MYTFPLFCHGVWFYFLSYFSETIFKKCLMNKGNYDDDYYYNKILSFAFSLQRITGAQTTFDAKYLRKIILIIWCHKLTHSHMCTWLTNTAVVVAGQLVTCVALTVVWALRVHTFVHAVVCQGTLISVCRKTQTHTHNDIRRHTHTSWMMFIPLVLSGLVK